MKELIFPLLDADDIEVRAGNYNSDKTKVNLLLYKTARTDAKYLDQVLGAYNWQKEYEIIDGKLYCTISIWDDDKKMWVKKQDVGVESNTEAEKGQASDAMKRAATMVGIGRELYTAPNIWVDANRKYFEVVEIGYNDKREINKLKIKDTSTKEIVYELGTKTTTSSASGTTNKNSLIAKINKYLINHSNARGTFYDWLDKHYGTRVLDALSTEQIEEIITKLKIG